MNLSRKQSVIVVGVVAAVAASALVLLAAQSTTYLVGTPVLATITNGTASAPWNLSQGDPGASSYASQLPGTLLPTYTPGGATTGSGEPNLAVYPGAGSGTDGASPYPSGTVGTPGPLSGYCGAGNNAVEAVDAPARQPNAMTLPLAPAYFPHVVLNGDSSLTGYFDYRPKDADEAIVAARSTDHGIHWTYQSQALEQNPGYCPNADVNDDGQGHPNVIMVNGVPRLYTLQRAAGDNIGVGMLVHQLNQTPSDPLGLPAVEKVGVDPNNFAASGVSVNGTPTTIPLQSLIGTGPEQLAAGPFVDLTATPAPTAASVISCTGVGAQSLTGCTTTAPGGISVQSGDLIEQVIATISSNLAGSTPATGCSSGSTTPTTTGTGALPCNVPTGPNTTTGDGGLAGFGINVTNANNLTLAILNANAPNRLYIDGVAVYCSQSNAFPTNKIENCTVGPLGAPLTVKSGDPVTSDPIIPATAQQTSGLVAPDGIVGVLPSYPGAPSGSTIVMYTEKVLNYFIVGFTGGATTFSANKTIAFTAFPNSSSASLGSGPTYTFSLGDATSNTIVQETCTGLSQTAAGPPATFSLTGCNGPAGTNGHAITKNSYLGAPGAATVAGATLGQIGEGSATNAQKLLKNNEDLTVLRVAYTTDGVNFSTVGLANGGIISGGNSQATPGDPYSDINNPSSTTSPSNLNAYATPGTSLATEMRFVGSAGSIITNPDGSYGLFLSGAWAADGDSDAFNQIFYTTSTDGENWSIPVSVVSTDYTFSASAAQAAALAASQDVPLGISAYYSGRAYGPSVVQNPDGTLTMVFAGYRLPAPAGKAGAVYGTNPSALYTVGATDPALYRNILVVTLPVVIPSAQIATTASGLAYSRVSQTFNGTVTLKNISGSAISGPLQLLFTAMPTGVTVVNATGNRSGTPYMTISTPSPAPGQSVTLAVQFKNPTMSATTFTPAVYSGSIQ